MLKSMSHLAAALYFLSMLWLLLGWAESRVQPPGQRDAPLAGAAKFVLSVGGLVFGVVGTICLVRWAVSLV